ncbi:hypothetical protein MLD38_004494 [Melastoma candidum]|uniref:Uncharacterized protein n=1 Tax=Melastoma candidum TaxID=119954 RepID=A0ACB9SEG0_9MYRT|nr:hypothetical protein MLD38_004494 [Melastoma candidum]
MWALRCRTAHGRLIHQCFGSLLPHLLPLDGEVLISSSKDYSYAFVSPGLEKLNRTRYVATRGTNGQFSFSSQAGERSHEEEGNTEDWFSEIGKPVGGNSKHDHSGNADEELISEPSPPEDDGAEAPGDERELLEKKTDVGRTGRPDREASSPLFKAIITNPGHPVGKILHQWVQAGNTVDQQEFWSVMLLLRRRQLYAKALQVSEWWEGMELSKLSLRDYASRVDLIAKVRGVAAAEKCIKSIPEEFRGEVVYRTLLANSVAIGDVDRSEGIFNKMRDLDFPLSAFSCNQLILLYKRVDRKKIADVLLLMEKENVKPTLFTYKILFETKARTNDLTGVDEIVEMMKAEGIEPDFQTQCNIAKNYIAGGCPEKAEAMLKEMEGGDLKRNRPACIYLLPLYAELGNVEEVRRVWTVCESKPSMVECTALIEAWGKLNNVEEAEAVFDKMSTTWKRLGSQHYLSLLKVYANKNMLIKGKDLVRRMSDEGCHVGPLIWDAVVKLYLGAGEVEKADAFLNKASMQEKGRKPLYFSLLSIMKEYARRGDVHNTEKMFIRMRQFGYTTRIQQFRMLVQAYANAHVPAYGLRERMMVDNIFPDRALAEQLAKVDAFQRKSGVEALLE